MVLELQQLTSIIIIIVLILASNSIEISLVHAKHTFNSIPNKVLKKSISRIAFNLTNNDSKKGIRNKKYDTNVKFNLAI